MATGVASPTPAPRLHTLIYLLLIVDVGWITLLPTFLLARLLLVTRYIYVGRLDTRSHLDYSCCPVDLLILPVDLDLHSYLLR